MAAVANIYTIGLESARRGGGKTSATRRGLGRRGGQHTWTAGKAVDRNEKGVGRGRWTPGQRRRRRIEIGEGLQVLGGVFVNLQGVIDVLHIVADQVLVGSASPLPIHNKLVLQPHNQTHIALKSNG